MLQDIASFLLHHLVFALMLSIGLAARREDLREAWAKRGLYRRALLVMFIGVPLLAIAVVRLFDLDPLVGGVILVMSICPGAPFIPFATKEKGKEFSPEGLALILLASVLALAGIPLWLSALGVFFPSEVTIPMWRLTEIVGMTILLPLAIGAIVRRIAPRAADVLASASHWFFLVSALVAVGLALFKGGGVLAEIRPPAALACVVMTVVPAAMGWWAAKPHPEARTLTITAAVLGHPGMAAAVVVASELDMRKGALLLAYLMVRVLLLLPIRVWVDRHRPDRPAPAHPPRFHRPRLHPPHRAGT